MVSVQRILFLLGFVALGAGIVLIGVGAISAGPAKTTQSHEIYETVVVPPGSDHESICLSPEILIHAVLSRVEDIRIEGSAFETDGLNFNFYLLTQNDYELWKMGRAYTAYFEGENRSNYGFTISPRLQDFEELLFLVEGENRAVRLSAIVRWTGTDFLGTLFNLPALMFFVYGLSCVAGGFILIFLFKQEKKEKI